MFWYNLNIVTILIFFFSFFLFYIDLDNDERITEEKNGMLLVMIHKTEFQHLYQLQLSTQKKNTTTLLFHISIINL